MREFETHRLGSGLTVHLLEYEGPSTVAVLRIGIGKLDDPEKRAGTAHIIEHMLAGVNEPGLGFLGRSWCPDKKIHRWKPAGTGPTYTDFRLLCEQGFEENFFRHLRDRFFRSDQLIDLDYHLQCVLNERLYRGSDDASLDLLAELFSHPRLDTATSLPDMANIMTFSLADVREHHRRWYKFGNANIIMASPRPWAELEPLFASAFEKHGARSNGLPPNRERAKPIRQTDPMTITARPNQESVKLRMLSGLSRPLHPAVSILFRSLIRVRLMDGLRASFRISYSPQISFEHHGVATIFRIKARASRHMAPTLRDGVTGPLEDTSWVAEYLEPVREEVLAKLNLEPEDSVLSRITDFATLLHIQEKPVSRQEILDKIATTTCDEILSVLNRINRVGFHMTLS